MYVSQRCPDVCSDEHVPTLLGAYSASCSRAGENTQRDRGYWRLTYQL